MCVGFGVFGSPAYPPSNGALGCQPSEFVGAPGVDHTVRRRQHQGKISPISLCLPAVTTCAVWPPGGLSPHGHVPTICLRRALLAQALGVPTNGEMTQAQLLSCFRKYRHYDPHNLMKERRLMFRLRKRLLDYHGLTIQQWCVEQHLMLCVPFPPQYKRLYMQVRWHRRQNASRRETQRVISRRQRCWK